jgi:UPF0755 protein
MGVFLWKMDLEMGWLRKTGLGLAILSVAVTTWAGLEGYRRFTGPGPLRSETTLVIPKGSGLETIARKLHQAGIIYDPYSFMLGVKLHNGMMKAGEYAFQIGQSAQSVME